VKVAAYNVINVGANVLTRKRNVVSVCISQQFYVTANFVTEQREGSTHALHDLVNQFYVTIMYPTVVLCNRYFRIVIHCT
jgi:hypothetical protein